MQTSIETALAQHVRNVTFRLQQFAGKLEVPTMILSSHESSGHNFSIAHLALLIFMMVKGFEHIVAQAKYCYNLGVHVFPPVRCELATTTLPENTWTFTFLHL
jgi:hypothetical protein